MRKFALVALAVLVSTPAWSFSEIDLAKFKALRICENCDLSEVILRTADLSGAKLFGANLSGANLSGSDLREANLRKANLNGANLSGANLRKTTMTSAKLFGADLSGLDLTTAQMIFFAIGWSYPLQNQNAVGRGKLRL